MDIQFLSQQFRVESFRYDSALFDQAARLRHSVYCEERGWLPSSHTQMEYEKRDRYAYHIAAFTFHREIVGYVRIVPDNPAGFLIDHDMRPLLPAQGLPVPREAIGEVSRLVDTPALRETYRGYDPHMLFYKAVYQAMEFLGKTYWLVEVTPSYLRYIRAQRMPFRVLSEPTLLEGGTPTIAAIMDQREYTELLRTKKPKLYEWFTRDTPLKIV